MNDRVRNRLIFASIVGFVTGNLLAMMVAISRAEPLPDPSELTAYIVNPDGEELLLGPLASPTPLQYHTKDGEVYIFVHNPVLSCQFDVVHWDRFETALNL